MSNAMSIHVAISQPKELRAKSSGIMLVSKLAQRSDYFYLSGHLPLWWSDPSWTTRRLSNYRSARDSRPQPR